MNNEFILIILSITLSTGLYTLIFHKSDGGYQLQPLVICFYNPVKRSCPKGYSLHKMERNRSRVDTCAASRLSHMDRRVSKLKILICYLNNVFLCDIHKQVDIILRQTCLGIFVEFENHYFVHFISIIALLLSTSLLIISFPEIRKSPRGPRRRLHVEFKPHITNQTTMKLITACIYLLTID